MGEGYCDGALPPGILQSWPRVEVPSDLFCGVVIHQADDVMMPLYRKKDSLQVQGCLTVVRPEEATSSKIRVPEILRTSWKERRDRAAKQE